MKQKLKFTSFSQMSNAINAKGKEEQWSDFLKLKGHTGETFDYLPEDLKTSLKFSFASKYCNDAKSN